MSDKVIKISFWDTAGDPIYAPITKHFYKAASGALLVVDISILYPNLEELLNIWMQRFKEAANENAQIILIGSKADLPEQDFTVSILEKYSYDQGIDFIKTSSLTMTNIKEAVERLVVLVDQACFTNFEGNYIDSREEDPWRHSGAHTSVLLPSVLLSSTKVQKKKWTSKLCPSCCS